MKTRSFKHWCWLLVLIPALGFSADVNKVLETERKTQAAAKQSQKRVDRTSQDTQKLLEEYRQTLWRTKQLNVYAKQLSELVSSQKVEKASLQKQVDAVDDTQEAIMPLMLRMVDTLEEFIKLDIPFLPVERADRVAKLREEMNNAETSVAVKYRRVLEAYQIEAEYGRTLESYRGELQFKETIRAVDFLRLGRVGLYYISIDGEQAGYWNVKARAWRPLDDSYKQAIRRGMQLAKQQIAPELLELPVPVPEVVKSSSKGGRR